MKERLCLVSLLYDQGLSSRSAGAHNLLVSSVFMRPAGTFTSGTPGLLSNETDVVQPVQSDYRSSPADT